MQNHLTRILVNEFIYPAYIHSDTIHFMVGHPGLKPGRLQDDGFTEIFLKIQQLKSLSSLEKKSGCPVRCVYQFHQ